MNFSSVSEFINMGGHGLYVWLSYGAALIIIAYNVAAARWKQQRAWQMVRDRERRRAAEQAPLDRESKLS